MRHFTFVFALFLFICALIAAEVPLLLALSLPGWHFFYTALNWATLGIPNFIGGLAMSEVLCPMARNGCNATITLDHTQTILQALFTFAIATGVLFQLRESAEKALSRLQQDLEERFSQITVTAFTTEYKERAEAYRQELTPKFERLVRWTHRAALICFYSTAIIAGALMAVTFVSASDIPLEFKHATSIAFAMAPFVCVALLLGDRLICERLCGISCAPLLYFRPETLERRAGSVSQRIADQAEDLRRQREENAGQREE